MATQTNTPAKTVEPTLAKKISDQLKEATTAGTITKDELKLIAKVANSLVVLIS